MKKLLVVTLTLFTFVGFAQRPNKEKMRNAVQKRLAEKGKGSPEDRAKIESKQMTLRLDLINDQQTKAEKALLTHFTAQDNKRREIRKSEKKVTPEDRQKMQEERLDAQIALKKKMKLILNDEQYKKYSQMMERKMGKGKRRGKKK